MTGLQSIKAIVSFFPPGPYIRMRLKERNSSSGLLGQTTAWDTLCMISDTSLREITEGKVVKMLHVDLAINIHTLREIASSHLLWVHILFLCLLPPMLTVFTAMKIWSCSISFFSWGALLHIGVFEYDTCPSEQVLWWNNCELFPKKIQCHCESEVSLLLF